MKGVKLLEKSKIPTSYNLYFRYGKKYCYGSSEGEYCHCDYCKCKHGYGVKGYGGGGCGGGKGYWVFCKHIMWNIYKKFLGDMKYIWNKIEFIIYENNFIIHLLEKFFFSSSSTGNCLRKGCCTVAVTGWPSSGSATNTVTGSEAKKPAADAV